VQLSNLLKTVHPVKFHGIRVKSSEPIMETRNPEHHDPDISRVPLSPDPEIGSIHYRSQDVEPGGLFVAIKGLVADGHDFIDDALSRGASVIVTQKPVNRESVIIEVENTRRALATISGRFYSNPSEKLFLIGITGTNGKTTTAFLMEQILSQAGINVGVIGTLNYRYAGKTFQNPITTPESLDLQKILAQMLGEGITHVVMEVSSHALDLDRVYNCKFDLGAFTNLTQDHLDYHKDMDSYWSCKKKFFTEILGPKSGNDRPLAVINHNDERGKQLIRLLGAGSGEISVLSTGFSDKTSIWAERFDYNLTGISGRISTPEGFFEFKSSLVGQHNLENLLCATGVGIALGISLDIIKDAIESVAAVPGRLETIPNDNNRFVYVDYAHTPDALENVLSALRSSAPGRLICVFGCGGNRDRTKRPQMGEIAGRLSDLVIVTSDNPRTEPPMEIIDEILDGTKNLPLYIYTPSDLKEGFQKKGCVVEPDRRNAIQLAITASLPKDTVLIAGKGNETYQVIGDQTLSFDDREEAGKALSMIDGQGSAHKFQGCSEPQTANPKSGTLDPIPWTVGEILKATGGELFCGDSNNTFAGISIDSRRISVEDLFIAIKGDVHDGHNFIVDVMKKGVGGFLVEKNRTHKLSELKLLKPGITCVTINDTGKALGDLAAFNRKRTDVSVIAITGSNGKTSTRNMTTDVVSRRFCTLSTQGNLNNEIGLPLTLLNLNRNHRWAVLELGMNRPGEIERLAQICLPDLGVITNIGPAHLEGLGSLEAVMQAKGELLGKIKPEGTAILNADDPRLLKLADTTSRNVLLFGVSADAAIRAESITEKTSGLSFVLVLPGERIRVDLKTPAVFMISNALAAAAVGHLLGLTAGEIKEGLEVFKPVPGRMNILKTDKGVHIIDDTYNANPGSMEAAMKTFKSLKGQGRGILILGDMLELGEHAESLHREMGSKAVRSGIERIYVTGDYAENVVAGALDEDMDSSDIFIGTRKEILEDIIGRIDAGDWILVKGSRGMAMEKVVEGLLRRDGN
jgi:murE/murF fusion protein